MLELRGAYTALVTPMTSSGEVDYDGFRRLVAFQIENGISGLVPLGTTGETPTLERDEQDRLIAITVEETKKRVPVIVGTGTNSTRHTIENIKRAKQLGADVALVVTPYYNKPTNEGIYRHFAAIADGTDMPVLVYNIAGRTGKNIDVPTMDRISRIPTVVGVKEASGDLGQMGDVLSSIAATRRSEGKYFSVLSGDDALTLALCAMGGDGVVSVVSNLVPRRVSDLVAACLSSDFEVARKLHYGLLPLFKGAFIETNPIPIKTAMAWAGLPAGPMRLPLCELDPSNETKLRASLSAAGVGV